MTETFRFVARRISETPDEVLMLSFSLLSLVGIILVAYWFHNRRKLHQLSHQIPASVVKNYLDSIIQNSSALKSSLFRGGGLDMGEGIPSVMPLGDLPRGNVSLSSGGASSEELNQKLAEIATLTKRVSDKELMIRQLEAKLKELSENAPSSSGEDHSEEIGILKSEVKRLQAELEKAKAAKPAVGGNNSELEAQLSSVTQERDELKERLMEYEIIEEDLANLKRLQQENEQLKNQLAGLGAPAAKAAPAQPAAAPEPAVEENSGEDSGDDDDLEAAMAAAITESEKPKAAAPAPEPAAEPAAAQDEEEEDLEAAMAAAIGGAAEPPAEEAAPEAKPEPKAQEKPKSASDQKSAEELLSEFEKMLG